MYVRLPMVGSLPRCVDLRMGNWFPVAAGLPFALGSLSRLSATSGFGVMAADDRPTSTGDQYGGSTPDSAAYSVTGLPSALSLPRSSSALAAGLPVLPPVTPVWVGPGHVLHPFSVNHFDAGSVCQASIAHDFNYRITVLRDGIKQATRTVYSSKAERSFLDDNSLPWGQQVVVMFQFVCALALDVPAAAESVTDFHGVSPDVLLAYEPWGHVSWCLRGYGSSV